MSDAGGLTTQRLALTRFTGDDVDLLDGMHGDPEIARHIGGVKTRAETATLLQVRILDYYAKHPGLGCWKTIERATGACVGYHLLNHIRGEEHIQVGYALFKPYWGRGYATEMSIALLRYGFAGLGLPRITAITDLPHVVSQRVLLKCGLRRDGERSFKEYAKGAPLAWFERGAVEWLKEFGG